MSFYNRQEKGRPISIYDEGVLLTSNVGSINFTGAGVTGTISVDAVTETIPGGLGTPIYGEVPSGTNDGVNKVFTLAHTPISGTAALYLNGARQLSGTGNDYAISGTTITFTYAPPVNSNILVDYAY